MKKFVSVIMALAVCLVFAVPVFADDSTNEWQTVDSIKIGGFEAGGGSTRGGGVGRREYKVPADEVTESPGYISPGTPKISKDGNANYIAILSQLCSADGGYFPVTGGGNYAFATDSNVKYSLSAKYSFTAPVAGTVYWPSPSDIESYFIVHDSDGFQTQANFDRSSDLSEFLNVSQTGNITYSSPVYWFKGIYYHCPDIPVIFTPLVPDGSITTVNNTTITGDTIYKDITNNFYYSYTGGDCTVYYPDSNGNPSTSVTYNEGDNNYYITVFSPSVDPSVTPVPEPSFVPGGGSTRGGGVGRRPSDLADWTEGWYCLNDHLYRAYYANKAVDDCNGSIYYNDPKKLSTTEIPVASGTYDVTVPDGVQWRAWRFDENTQKVVSVNSSNWKGSSAYTFATDDNLIFEFQNQDGSDIHPLTTVSPVMLTLENDNITEYVPGAEQKPGATPAPSATPSPDAPIVIDKQPQDVSIKSGTSTKYSIEAHSTIDSELSYYWEWSSDDGETWRGVSQRVPIISTATNMSMNGRIFRCTVSDAAGNQIVSSSALLQVWETEPPPTPTPEPSPTPSPTPPSGGGGGDGDDTPDPPTNPLDWLGDLLAKLAGAILSILMALLKLIMDILGFLPWLVGQLSGLCPFLPTGFVPILVAGVVIVIILRIVKFILGR